MKKICMILAPRMFRDLEFIVPKAFFEANNFEIITTSTEYISTWRFGYIQKHKKLIYDLQYELFDAIVFVGGTGSLELWEDEKIKQFTIHHLENNKIVSAICASPRNFLKWDIVKGKKLTGNDWDNNFWALAENAWAIHKKEGLVRDGNLITAYGPENSEEFANAIIQALSE